MPKDTLQLEDIQHFLLARPPALAARYVFLAIHDPAQGRQWLDGLIDKVGTGEAVAAAGALDSRWVTVAFTWNGLRAAIRKRSIPIVGAAAWLVPICTRL